MRAPRARDTPGCKGLAHEAAHARVVRRVHDEERAQAAGAAGDHLGHAIGEEPRHVGARAVHREELFAQHGVDLARGA